MRAELFYDTCNDRAIPLYLISQTQWDEGIDSFTSVERNGFALKEFKGKIGDFCIINNADGLIDKVYIGSGDGVQELALANAALQLPAGTYEVQSPTTQEAALFWALAQYRFDAYKKNTMTPRCLFIAKNELANLLALADAHFLVRDLINTPTDDLGPKELSDVVVQLAQAHNAKFTQWVGDELLTENFPAIHAVGRAAHSEPRLLSLIWGKESHPKVTLVGKGVCFDTGGLDIKSAYGMRLMKKDMGGAAHVIGLAQWIMARRLPVRLHMLVPAVENAIGPNAFRPGDILTMRNGLTVEVHNTDAEGRLVLADALTKACEEQPDLLIDFATLTGAARVSVGTEISAFFTNNEKIATEISSVAEKTADQVWRLPLFSPYEDYLKSNIADMANASDHPYAGAIIASLFLQHFIGKITPWVHFDIMAWSERSKPGKPEGGEAMGLRVVAEYLLRTYG
ncbi:MAG: leucyl aminopeptidase family protein [Legionella sp.]|uniref:leucyl aminopeptidase family protein n=1 Tax=Legionella sp. TaxID=459 RepID=UPI0039E3042C